MQDEYKRPPKETLDYEKTDTNLKQIAYETIKQKIIQCEYRPGDILSEMMLMEEIDASRTPIP